MPDLPPYDELVDAIVEAGVFEPELRDGDRLEFDGLTLFRESGFWYDLDDPDAFPWFDTHVRQAIQAGATHTPSTDL